MTLAGTGRSCPALVVGFGVVGMGLDPMLSGVGADGSDDPVRAVLSFRLSAGVMLYDFMTPRHHGFLASWRQVGLLTCLRRGVMAL